jgi:hypothetical protein
LTFAAIVSLPAITALVLGVIYGAGAIARSSELARAGLPVFVAFPLIPISQDLARGVQIFVQPVVLITGILVVISLVLFGAVASTSPKGLAPILKFGRWLLRFPGVLLLVLVVVVLLITQPLFFLTLVLATLGVVIVLLLAAPEGQRIQVLRPRDARRYYVSPRLGVIALLVGLTVAASSRRS